jgi:hypothetical protein
VILLVGRALRPCNRSRSDELDRKCKVRYLLAGRALRPWKLSRRDEIERKGRGGYYR